MLYYAYSDIHHFDCCKSYHKRNGKEIRLRRSEKNELGWSSAVTVPNPPCAGCCEMIYITVIKKKNEFRISQDI